MNNVSDHTPVIDVPISRAVALHDEYFTLASTSISWSLILGLSAPPEYDALAVHPRVSYSGEVN